MKLPWRKLICDPRSSWTRLPLLTRGVGDELLRASDDDGRIVLDGEAPAQVVYRLLAVHPLERRRVREALDELSIAGWVTITTAAILVHVGEAHPQKPDLSRAQPQPDPNATRAQAEPNPSPTRTRPEPKPSPTSARPEPDNRRNAAISLVGTGTALSEREEERRGEVDPSLRSGSDARDALVRGGLGMPAARPPCADGLEHIEHLHAESRRALGRAWFGLRDVRAGWLGGGPRVISADVDRVRAVLAWAVDPERTGGLDPRVAITRSVEGYARTDDAVVVRSRRPLALFASDPGRWLSVSRASSAEPSDFSKAPTAPDLPDWMTEATDVR